MIFTLLTALMTAAPMANGVTIVIVRPVIVIVHPVTVAPVSRPSVTNPAPVTRAVTPSVTPAVVPLPAYTVPRTSDVCASERKMRGDCYTM